MLYAFSLSALLSATPWHISCNFDPGEEGAYPAGLDLPFKEHSYQQWNLGGSNKKGGQNDI